MIEDVSNYVECPICKQYKVDYEFAYDETLDKDLCLNCSEDRQDFKNNLSKISTFDLIEELKSRDEVKSFVNDRSSCDCVISIDFQRSKVLMGEHVILAIEGNYNG